MLDTLKIIKHKGVTVTAETPQGEQIDFYIIFDVIMRDNKYYTVLRPYKRLGDFVNRKFVVYKYTRINKVKSLVPATEEEEARVINFRNNPSNELISLFDENGKDTGKWQVRLKDNSTPEGVYFAAVEAWIKLSNNKLLLLQRHPDKDFGLMWECTGGAVGYRETFAEAIVREIYEETDIVVREKDLKYLGVTKRNNWFCHSFLLNLNCVDFEIEFQKEECAAYKWVDVNDVDSWVNQLTDGHKETLLKYYSLIAAN